jgi:hypothetical protein
MRDTIRTAWGAFANIAIMFSFVVNLILVVVLSVMISPLFQFKSGMVEPLLYDLDRAFLGLGETDIETTVAVDQAIGIQFDLPLDQPLDLDFDLPINQETVVVLTQAVPLNNLSARFNLPGGGGQINGTVSLSLPAGMQLPIRLDLAVPVETTVPVQMTVPVSQSVQVRMVIPVEIPLGDAGLDAAVQELRDVFVPLRTGLERMPDRIQFW